MDKATLRSEAAQLIAASTVEVQKVEPGFRALARAQKSVKTGRPREEGERYACGKLKPSTARGNIEPIAPAAWDRLRNERLKAADDARFGSEVGRLSLQAELTATQASAAYRIADIYGRFERYRGLRRSSGSASYMVASSSIADDEAVEAITPEMLARSMAEELLDDEALAELERRIDAADKRFLKLQHFLRSYPANIRNGLELLCVDDQRVNPAMLEPLSELLDEAAVFFRIKAAPKDGKKVHREILVNRDGTKKDVSPDRLAFFETMRRLRPDMSEPDIARAYDLNAALRMKKILEREKGRGPGRDESAGVSEVMCVARSVSEWMALRARKLGPKTLNS